MIYVYFDGLCEPRNPAGIATYGFVVKQDDDEVLHRESGIVGEPFSLKVSNNVAEYTALIHALQWLIDNHRSEERIIVRGDSQLVILQLRGIYDVKAARVIPLYQEVVKLLKSFPKVRFEWIRRERNAEADELSNEAYQKYIAENPALVEKIKPYLATPKQIAFLRRLGVEPDPNMSKIQASRAISKLLRERRFVTRRL